MNKVGNFVGQWVPRETHNCCIIQSKIPLPLHRISKPNIKIINLVGKKSVVNYELLKVNYVVT